MNREAKSSNHILADGLFNEKDPSSFTKDYISQVSDELQTQSQMIEMRKFSKRAEPISSEINERLCHHHDNLKNNKTAQQLTITKLHLGSLGLIGREREAQTLKNCLKRMSETKRKELIFVEGCGGVGKTTLAHHALEKAVNKNGIFAKGKFSVNSDDVPYQGIADVFSEICSRIIEMQTSAHIKDNDRQSPGIGEIISSELGSDLYLLARLIPELEGVVSTVRRRSDVSEASMESNINLDDFKAQQEKWKYLIRTLIRVLTSFVSPLIIALDNLQWADAASLEVIEMLISDTQNPNPIMIVGLYRSTEVDDSHILATKIHNISEKEHKSRFNLTDIRLRNFKMNGVNSILMKILAIDDEDSTRDLARVCFKKTMGNPFFLIEFVTMLEEESLISFNLGLLQWKWDKRQIENETSSTANVVDLLQARMERLPKQAHLLLQYAACLGSSFRLSTLFLVYTQHAADIIDADTLPDLLSTLEKGNFLERTGGDDEYRFVHDKVKEAVLMLADTADESSFQFEIGMILYHALTQSELKDKLFDVVNLINKSQIRRRPDFAELNLRAAEKARGLSAFRSAAAYIANGIRLLPHDKWNVYRRLTHSLYKTGAAMELALGNMEQMESYIYEVLTREDCTLLEKFPLYMTLSYKICNVDLGFHDSIQFCLEVLEELGVSVPTHGITLPMKAMSQLLKTVRKAKMIPADYFETPKYNSDPIQRAAMIMLAKLYYSAFHTKNKLLLIFCTTRMVEMTWKYGISSMSGSAYATLGLMTIGVFQDFETASSFAEIALTIQASCPSRYTDCATSFAVHNFIFAWTKPLLSCSGALLQAYKSGMKSGNTLYACWSLTANHIVLPYNMGKPLTQIEKSLETCSAQIEEVKQMDPGLYLKMLAQMIKNLRGDQQKSKMLLTDDFDSGEVTLQNTSHEIFFRFTKMQVLVYFGEYRRAAYLAMEIGDEFEKTFPANINCMAATFFRGVALYAEARLTRRRKVKRRAKCILKTIKGWLQKGNPNVKHHYSLLSAEQAALDKDYISAEKYYKEAISVAARTGNLHHSALSSERYADFLRRERSLEEDADYQLEDAVRFYKEWGAEGKAKALQSTSKLQQYKTCSSWSVSSRHSDDFSVQSLYEEEEEDL